VRYGPPMTETKKCKSCREAFAPNPDAEQVGYIRLCEQPPLAKEIPEPEWWTPAEVTERDRLARQNQANEAFRDEERAENAHEMREAEGIARHELLLQKAFQDVRQVIEHGYHEEYDRDGFVESCHFSELGRDCKFRLLERSIDWGGYVQCGMHPDTPPLIMMNAADGKPPERWLEGIPEEAKAPRTEQPKLRERDMGMER
jgi:hypothetical protein